MTKILSFREIPKKLQKTPKIVQIPRRKPGRLWKVDISAWRNAWSYKNHKNRLWRSNSWCQWFRRHCVYSNPNGEVRYSAGVFGWFKEWIFGLYNCTIWLWWGLSARRSWSDGGGGGGFRRRRPDAKAFAECVCNDCEWKGCRANHWKLSFSVESLRRHSYSQRFRSSESRSSKRGVAYLLSIFSCSYEIAHFLEDLATESLSVKTLLGIIATANSLEINFLEFESIKGQIRTFMIVMYIIKVVLAFLFLSELIFWVLTRKIRKKFFSHFFRLILPKTCWIFTKFYYFFGVNISTQNHVQCIWRAIVLFQNFYLARTIFRSKNYSKILIFSVIFSRWKMQGLL